MKSSFQSEEINFSQKSTERINCQWICPVRNVRSSSSMRGIVIEVSHSQLHKERNSVGKRINLLFIILFYLEDIYDT